MSWNNITPAESLTEPADSFEPELSRMVSSEMISRTKLFKTQAEAQAWYDAQRLELLNAGFTVRENDPNDMWAIPPVEHLGKDGWSGFIDADKTVWEDVPAGLPTEGPNPLKEGYETTQ